MSLLKRTYALPFDVVAQFEEAVRQGERSSIVAGLLQGWVDEWRRAELARAGSKAAARLPSSTEKSKGNAIPSKRKWSAHWVANLRRGGVVRAEIGDSRAVTLCAYNAPDDAQRN
jgi:hypothetical protein